MDEVLETSNFPQTLTTLAPTRINLSWKTRIGMAFDIAEMYIIRGSGGSGERGGKHNVDNIFWLECGIWFWFLKLSLWIILDQQHMHCKLIIYSALKMGCPITKLMHSMIHALILCRGIWRATIRNFPEFPAHANTRHLRKSATALAHLYGDAKLKGSIHEALNHSEKTNSSNYQSLLRKSSVIEAKASVIDLRKKTGQQIVTSLHLESAGAQTSQQSRQRRPPRKYDDYIWLICFPSTQH